MTAERWARIKQVVGAALEKPDSERSAFADWACGSDTELRQEVERLLDGYASGSLQSPVEGVLHVAPLLGFTPGQTVGRYRVERMLARGGMGTVYKAWDAQLQRPVALKFLSAAHFGNPAVRQRFLREARAASALNHPNIVTIHEIGSHDGVDFIAMEYINGESLDRIIPADGLPVQQALLYSIGVADALATAHAAGIAHRDVKPQNVMVTADRVVKLLDFGLARRVLLRAAPGSTLTQAGEIVGTPAYMSPEQAEGKAVDERSDIFSFGVLLYEMLAGRPAFSGDSTAAILGAVLTRDPAPLRGVSPELNKLVFRCLRKQPANRIQRMEDVRLTLDSIRRDISQQWFVRIRSRLAGAAVVLACAAVLLWLVAPGGKPPAGEMTLIPLTTLPGFEIHPSFSPDGSQVAFSWNGENQENYDIYIKVVGSAAAPLRITKDPVRDEYPAWSPDGRQIAFSRLGALYLVSPVGGAERKVAELQRPGFGHIHDTFNWSQDGKWLAATEGPWHGPRSIVLISADRGDKRVLLSEPGFPRAPAFSPDGRHIAYARCTAPLGGTCDLYLLELSLNSGRQKEPRRLTDQGQVIVSLAWLPNGQSLLYAAGPCQDSPFSLWRLGVFGKKASARMLAAGWDAASPAIPRAGERLAFSRRSVDMDIWMIRPGRVEPVRLVASTWSDANAQYSPDGKRIAFSSGRSGGCPEIWVSDSDGANALQLTNDRVRYQGTPRWSPDGQWIAFDHYGEDGRSDVHIMDRDGRRRRRLTTFASDEGVPSWSRDGKSIYFRSNRSGKDEIWKMSLSNGQAVQVTDAGGYVAFESFDAGHLYYLKSALNAAQPLFKRSLAGGPEQVAIPDSVGFRAFLPVSGGIYYLSPKTNGAEHVLNFYSLASGRTQVLAEVAGTMGQGLTVSPDRKSILFTMSQTAGADLMLMENFR